MSKKNALVIEDNKEIGEVYALTLRMINYEVEHITDGKAALDYLEGAVPDVIVLDMNLPQVSGHYIYKKLRADNRMDKVVVIIATANNLVADALKEELHEGDYLLLKPVSPKQLKEIANSI